MKVAIVHDDFIQRGGAERLVLAMLEIWPQADLYSVIASDRWQNEIKNKFGKEVKTSWLQKFPFIEKLFRQYYFFYPLAIESFRFNGYDLVISSSARYAHGVLTKPGTLHVAYVNSPARFIWQEDLVPKGFFIGRVINWHKVWDRVASTRPDYIVANSNTPGRRIEKYWNRKPNAIIYPFVDLARFSFKISKRLNLPKNGYFLIVARLSRWKRVDFAIEACNDLRLPLVIVGSGEDRARLKGISGPTTVFLDDVSDEEMNSIYDGCQALIMTQGEDFGITALEAQACGKPVIAYKSGGALETLVEGVTGVFFDRQDKESLKQVLMQFDPRLYLRENCTIQAYKFSRERFKVGLEEFCKNVLRNN